MQYEAPSQQVACLSEVLSKEEPHFSIIWTSKKLTAHISDDFIQDDATYRLTWQGYPFFVSGRSTPTGKFFATHVSLSSHEDTRAWKSSYKFVEKIATPKYSMGDGAQEITNAGEEVFGDEGTRLMCWPHSLTPTGTSSRGWLLLGMQLRSYNSS